LLHNHQQLQSYGNTHEAYFPLEFKQGTKMEIVHIKFSVQVDIYTFKGKFSQTIESSISSPFIVITTESQWCSAESRLIKNIIFADSIEVPYFKFCNCFQFRFFTATRQNPEIPIRILAPSDFNYLYTKFFNETGKFVAKIESFDSFWQWFGVTLQTLRYQKNLSKLWQLGYIYGFIDRDQLKVSLKDFELGSFIIRFSEKFPGKLAITYNSLMGDGMKHYLVTQQDMNTKRTLADFIIQSNNFLRLLKFEGFNQNGVPMFKSVAKTESFKPFISDQLTQEIEDDDYSPLQPVFDFNSFEDNKKKKKTRRNEI